MAKKKARPVEERPPEPPPVLPTLEEILSLPYWTRVAFCARAVRRVLPLVAHCWETVVNVKYLHSKYHLTWTAKCVRHTEQAAAKAGIVDETAHSDSRSGAASAWNQAAYAADLAGREKDVSPQYAASYAACAAHEAATAAFISIKPDWQVNYYFPAWFAAKAGELVGAGAAVELAIRADFDKVKAMVKEKEWGDETPVPPKVFGPLWPDGPPPGWPPEA